MSDNNSFFKSMASSARTGTLVFSVIAILNLIAQGIDKLFYAMSVPVWNAWDNYHARKVQEKNEHGINPDEIRKAAEMYNSLSDEDKARFMIDLDDRLGQLERERVAGENAHGRHHG